MPRQCLWHLKKQPDFSTLLTLLYFLTLLFGSPLHLPLVCCRNNKMAIASENMVFYYMARDNLCFLTLCEEAYPKRLAFLYLDEIADIILHELLQEYGTNVRIECSCVGLLFGGMLPSRLLILS